MADEMPSAEAMADEIFVYVKEVDGKKLLKPLDVIKMMKAKYGATAKKPAKAALQILTTDGRCNYEYAGGSYLKLAK